MFLKRGKSLRPGDVDNADKVEKLHRPRKQRHSLSTAGTGSRLRMKWKDPSGQKIFCDSIHVSCPHRYQQVSFSAILQNEFFNVMKIIKGRYFLFYLII